MADASPDHEAEGPSRVTRLLGRLAEGRSADQEDLARVVYEDLRVLAARHMAAERPGHTLQATALVHEAYVRLVGDPDLAWESRGHFFVAAAEAMRRILIEHARRRATEKRGGAWRRVSLETLELASDDSHGILALEEALQRLEKVDGRAARIVHLRFYGGLDVDETASALAVSRRTVLREWAYARAWLCDALEASE